jgi:hypothetical protein
MLTQGNRVRLSGLLKRSTPAAPLSITSSVRRNLTMTKRDHFEQALASCYEVAVFVLEVPGAEIPPDVWRTHARVEARFCTLRYGLDMAKPIPDLEITDEGIRATLSFSCEPCKTFVPWDAVAAIEGDGERPKQRAQLRAV